MNRETYQRALTKIAWGYVLIFLNFNLSINTGTLNLLPGWVGVILLLQALDSIEEREPSAKLLKPFAFILILGDLLSWVYALFDGNITWIWYDIIIGVISLYFHFQLLTNLADIAKRDGSAYWKRIRFFRTYQTLLVTVLSFAEIGEIPIELAVSELYALIFGGLVIIQIIGLVWTLFAYKNEPTFDLVIPPFVQSILDQLNAAGHEAYIVGGCVRDALLHRTPKDWDVCTSAMPEETMAAFPKEKTIPTGLKHGTVTIMSSGNPVEVTTYRIDGEYEDSRHPKQVEFTRSLKEDLARRDFTINAMAYHPSEGVIDIYGGREDLRAGIIRCVGEPDKRFTEDALRIMRGLRFAATMGFVLEKHTADAMKNHKDLLTKVSKERIQVELSKLLVQEKAGQILMDFAEIFAVAAKGIVIPATPETISSLPKNLPTRLAEIFPVDTASCLRELKYDNETIKTAAALAKLRGVEPPLFSDIEMKQFLAAHGEKIARLHYARVSEAALAILENLLAEKPCYRIKDLDISGADLMEIGLQAGPKLGAMLEYLLEQVIAEKIENQRPALLAAAKAQLEQAAKEEYGHE